MKITFSLILCFFSLLIKSQELETIELLPPVTEETKDLTFLKKELQGKQLVMLGEQTHMYGNMFQMKARVIEFLHQELGFTTIAMESSMYDLWKMNLTGFDSKVFNNTVWSVWSSTLEFQRLVNYIDKNNLKVIGFDSQVNNASQFVEDFFAYCNSQNIKLELDEDDFGIIIEGVLETTTFEEDDISYKLYEKELKRIIGLLERLESNDTNFYWIQFVKSLFACSQDAQNSKEEILSTDFVNKNHNIRDKQMADNLLSYITRHPNEKIVCWADNVHIINNNSSVKNPIAKEFVSMGSHIKKELKEKVYSLASIHANDSLLDLGTKKWHATPIKSESFEGILKEMNKPFLFVSSDQKAMKPQKTTRILNFIDFYDVKLDELHDGYIFFQKATLPILETRRSEGTATSLKQRGFNKKIDQFTRDGSVVLKGQLLDEQSKEPIPFATLILKKEGIYRVADENGHFELPVKEHMVQDAFVSISSLGYEESKIPLNKLKAITFIKPKFEELQEVVVTGYLSPLTVLKEAISRVGINHPIQPFNFFRYGKVMVNIDDAPDLDLELITKDYDVGYMSPYVITQRVEQIKWNKNNDPEKYKYSSQFFSYRQNAIRFANILHKRKYKKFNVHFVKSNNPMDDEAYIVAFQSERNNWNYTNKGYPTKYSGRVYISKGDFAILKVVENWESVLTKDEIEKYFKGIADYKDIIETTIKEENICAYSQINDDGKYYATKYFNRRYSETLSKSKLKRYRVFERDSKLFDFEFNDVEPIEFEFREKKQTLLNRVSFDNIFWNSFYQRKILEE